MWVFIRDTTSSNFLIYTLLIIYYNDLFVLYCVFIQYVIIHLICRFHVHSSIAYLPLSPFNPIGPLIPAGPGKPAAPIGPLSPGDPEHITSYAVSLIYYISGIYISRAYWAGSYLPSPCLPSAPWGPSQVGSTHRN